MKYDWVTIDVERALYVDKGRETILCDRLSGPVTLVLKVRRGTIQQFIVPRHAESLESYGDGSEDAA